MDKLKAFLHRQFDVRQGEFPRTVLLAAYLFVGMIAYYILKVVSSALFLNKFDIDKLPWLSILIAVGGGFLASMYSRITIRFSLNTAVLSLCALSVGLTTLFWWLLHGQEKWVYYAFGVWTSLFGVIIVAQGWLIAANIFTSREARRLYGILGFGQVLGAWLGSEFVRQMADRMKTENQVLASAGFMVLTYGVYRLVLFQKGVTLSGAKGAEQEESIPVLDVLRDIRRVRHLQLIVIVMLMMFVVDELVKFLLFASFKQAYSGSQLTKQLALFFGTTSNAVTITLQLFLTTAVVRVFGIGGTLQIMPVSVSIASVASFLAPGVLTAQVARLTEASMRYSLNRTGLELLYLPLPLELKNRAKAFVDVFVDRFSRGLCGVIVIVLLKLNMPLRVISLVVLVFCAVWILMTRVAWREYVSTVRKRLAARRLDLEELRLSVNDPQTIAMLEETARSAHPRQIIYALTMLETLPDYDIKPLLGHLAGHSSPEVRTRVYEIAKAVQTDLLLQDALQELEGKEALPAVVDYALARSPDRIALAQKLLKHPNADICRSTLTALGNYPLIAQEAVTTEWITATAGSPEPKRRTLAAAGIGLRGVSNAEGLLWLLQDSDPDVVRVAMESASALQYRPGIDFIVQMLGSAAMRGDAVKALAGYGTKIAGTLADLLEDESIPTRVRRYIPRVLRRIHEQKSVDVLMAEISHPNAEIRGAILRALNGLRESAPNLHYGETPVREQILREARYYYELLAALEPFREFKEPGTATRLLGRTLEGRLEQTLERLFRLLGLRYPLKDIHAAYVAVQRGRMEEHSAALEFLEGTVDREIKRILIPMIDSSVRADQKGIELFGIKPLDGPGALAELLASKDPWLMCCAMASAAELRVKSLRGTIEQAGRSVDGDVANVAQSALAALA